MFLHASRPGDSSGRKTRFVPGHPSPKDITPVLFHNAFPVDIRHNAKIFREELANWATEQLENE